MNNKLKNILLWVAVLPSAFASLYISSILFGLLCNLENLWWGTENGIAAVFTDYVLTPFQKNTASSFIFVVVAYLIAPKFKVDVSMVAMIIICCIASVSLFIVNFISKDYYFNINLFFSILGGVFGYLYCKYKYIQDNK